MNDDEFLGRVRRRIEAEALSQAQVADACDLSQPHLSKVLAGRIKLARKTRAALTTWMGSGTRLGTAVDRDGWDDVVARLRSRDPGRVDQIMQLLRILDALVR